MIRHFLLLTLFSCSLIGSAKGAGGGIFEYSFEYTVCRIKAKDHLLYYFQIYQVDNDIYVSRVEADNSAPSKIDFSEVNLKKSKAENKLTISVNGYTEVGYDHHFYGNLYLPGITAPKAILLEGSACHLWTRYFDSYFDYNYTYREEVEDPGLRDDSEYDAKKEAILLEVQKLLSAVER